ncbi:hypothetical protein ABZ897_52830 [Nonomuraea sp. NPDC046802]|uniref:hypothetical protein n=1 Tax=Nonomuraea sp. NPDC046802 TaxID=3154919 RepID=UPI0033DD4C5C
MKGILVSSTFVCLFLLCALREGTPDARSASQMWGAAHRAGYGVKAVRILAQALPVHAELLSSLVTRTEVRA